MYYLISSLTLYKATYDPSHGYSPQPIDITHMALSRDLQVTFANLTFVCAKSKFD